MTPDMYQGAGYGGVSRDQAYGECAHEVRRDVNNAGAYSSSSAIVVASMAESMMDSCMAAKGFSR